MNVGGIRNVIVPLNKNNGDDEVNNLSTYNFIEYDIELLKVSITP